MSAWGLRTGSSGSATAIRLGDRQLGGSMWHAAWLQQAHLLLCFLLLLQRRRQPDVDAQQRGDADAARTGRLDAV